MPAAASVLSHRLRARCRDMGWIGHPGGQHPKVRVRDVTDLYRLGKTVTFRFRGFRVGFRVLGTFWAIFGKISAWRAGVKCCAA